MERKELKPIIEQSFTQYAGCVIQSRALVDVRDCLKPSARQIFYSMLLHKLISKNPYKKTANAVGLAMAEFYIHGDSSAEGIIMRAGQPFAMRYPLIQVKGNCGSLIESGNWAAMRYTESRLSPLMDLIFQDIDKNTIEEWRDNYDNTKQFPSVLPSKGFYNIVNGVTGIAVGMASSIPQYNLRELNHALIYLIDNPDCDFEEIYCAPDFATGGILCNEEEVKISMKVGRGASCKLRSVINYKPTERVLVVTEIPYGVYTNTICKQLEEIVDSEENPGIDRFNDLTGEKPLIKIYLTKKADPTSVLDYLYRKTSLQSHFSINFTALDRGRYPKVFTWKQMLQAHIDHEREVYKRGFNFDLAKIKGRLHILDALIICLASIDEVVNIIKGSSSSSEACKILQKKFLLDEEQAKAVLDIKLSRLAHLEVEKIKEEQFELQKKAKHIQNILSDEELFKQEIKKGLQEVMDKFGDDRRTELRNEIVISEKLYYFTKSGKVYLNVPKDEEVLTIYDREDDYLGISKNGTIYRYTGDVIRAKKIFPIKDDDSIIAVYPYKKDFFITLLDNEGHFRCKEVSSLGPKQTSVALSNITYCGYSMERTTKQNYRRLCGAKIKN